MYTQVGQCPKCGAPVYAPSVWGGVLPPPSHRTCGCSVEETTRSLEHFSTTVKAPSSNEQMTWRRACAQFTLPRKCESCGSTSRRFELSPCVDVGDDPVWKCLECGNIQEWKVGGSQGKED